MRILLASNAAYFPPRGGSTRSNLSWLRALAAAGHECRVLCAAAEAGTGAEREITEQRLKSVTADGIDIRPVEALARTPGRLAAEIADFNPDWVLVSSEDMAHSLLREADRAAHGRVVYLAHTPQFMPFGPESWNPELEAAECVRRAAGVVAISHTVAGYVQQHTGVTADVIHPPIYGTPPRPQSNAASNGFILMINPCAVKGIDIFISLAARFPSERFAVLPGWGTTARDRDRLAAISNIQALATVRDIEDVYLQCKMLLVPSLWLEGFGLVAMEAMLRGVPVVASDYGGLKESKQGTGFLIPIEPIRQYSGGFDDRHMPKALLPPIDLDPWVEAIGTLCSNPAAWRAESEASRRAAERFVGGLDARHFETYLATLKPKAAGLRILLAHNSLYYPSFGGGDKSNRLLMEALAARGHSVRVVSRVDKQGEEGETGLLTALAQRSVATHVEPGVVRFELRGVDVRTLTAAAKLREYFTSQIREFDPDVILTSTDDPAQIMIEPALNAERARVVHLIRATIAVPFGPDAAFPSESRTAALRTVDGAVGVSEYVARYVRDRSGGIPAVHVPISLLEPGREFPMLGSFDNEFVLFANPCAVKGLSIFLGLAAAMPDVKFAAVPTWGTTAEDLAALRALPNVTILEPVDEIDDLLKRAKAVLIPSVWAEARSRMALESLARGVPVLAADSGGLREAMCGVPYLLPVRPVTRYLPRVDEHMVPVPDVPEQDIGPWREALEKLVTDRAHHQHLSRQSRNAAMAYVDRLNVEPFEQYLRDVVARPRKVRTQFGLEGRVDRLSEPRRRLFAIRREKLALTRRRVWFPGIDQAPPGAKLLFCFPHAGGGTSQYHEWKQPFPDVHVTPVLLPGREWRVNESPITSFTELVETLARVIEPLTHQPYAFLGHSMGGPIAFELARTLRSRNLPRPTLLIVSAARAPRYRLNYVAPPDPDDAGLIAGLRKLNGLPEGLLDNPELLELVLPAVRADSALYRRYVYYPGAPLDLPIVAIGGTDDPNVTTEHLEAWREQTTAKFAMHQLPGGHFYINQSREALLRLIESCLRA